MIQSSNRIVSGKHRNPIHTWQKLWPILVLGGFVFMMVIVVVLLLIPAVSPSTGADTADMLRAIFGPQPVAVLESISFQLQDEFNQIRFELNGGAPQITWSSQQQSLPEATSTPTPPWPPSTQIPLISPQASETPAPAAIQSTPSPPTDVVADPPQIGWQAYGPSVNGQSVLARAMILLNPQHSYAGVALVRIDTSKLQLHIMPGFLEPSHSSQVVQLIPNLGMVPPEDQPNLIAAFNGGFKSLHGHYGMMVAGLTLLDPLPGIATVAIYRDGHVQIGTWGQDLQASPDMIAFRQNCPPLLQSGQVNPALSGDNRKAWGYTNNTDITWRTALGITQDGRYLIYAVGNGTSAETLAEALQQAGAYNAMQLDINQFYAHFFTYQPSDPATSKGFNLTGQRLVNEMIYNPHLYLTPYPRDFFYITLR